MCSHYQALKDPERYRHHFGVEPPQDMGKADMWPGYLGTMVRRHPQAEVGNPAVPTREALAALFGLLPPWSLDTHITRHTYNARSETVATRPSFRVAFKQAQHCIVPVGAFYEPDWRSGRPIPTRIERADGQPMGVAGLWSAWKSPQGQVVYSFTLLTLNASEHPLMRLFHQPADEKRMPVILPEDRYDAWLQAGPAQSRSFMRPYPAHLLRATQLLGASS